MKKILALVLAIAMLATFAACGEAKEAEYKLGVGTVVSLDSSAAAADGKPATAQADTTVATVVLDADGKIVACDIDVAQTKVSVADGVVDKANADLRTKTEKKGDYGMSAAVNYGMDWNNDGVVKEWYEQSKIFTDYVVGKTADEVKAIKTKEVEGKGYIIPADEDLLTAGCTIQVNEFIQAIVAACKDDQAKTFTAAADSFKLGLKMVTDVAESTDATDDAAASVTLYSDYSAAVVDADGKVIAAIVDAVQPKVAVNKDGTLGDKTYKNTKRALKADYGMAAAVNYGMDWNNDGVVKEWYEQSKIFTDYVVGKTADEVKAIKTKEVEGKGYIIPADEDLLTAGCTIQVSSYMTVIAGAMANAD